MLGVSREGVLISTPNRHPKYTDPDGTPRSHWHLREWRFEELDEILKRHGRVDWNFLNGPFEGPFTRTKEVVEVAGEVAEWIRCNMGVDIREGLFPGVQLPTCELFLAFATRESCPCSDCAQAV